jgi:hypothetical protein
MTAKDAAPVGFKQKAMHELIDFALISLYLAVIFCAVSTCAMLILRKYDVDFWNYSFSIINALIVAKIILIGEMAHVGRRVKGRALYQRVLYKSFVFGLLVFVFHIVEEIIKHLIHHHPLRTIWDDFHAEDLMFRTIVIIGALIPLFAWRELGRVIGEERLRDLFFKSGAAVDPVFPTTKF